MLFDERTAFESAKQRGLANAVITANQNLD
jgi:hypothetical protein